MFVDTAGLRRQSRIEPGLEYYSALRTARAIERADVCLLLVDATEPVHVQDLKIAETAWDAGCGLIMSSTSGTWSEDGQDGHGLREPSRANGRRGCAGLPIIFTSALTGQRVQKTLDLFLEVAAERSRRIATHEVNEVLRELVARQPPPHYRGPAIKLLYATQAETAPPTFVIFTNYPKAVPDHYAALPAQRVPGATGAFGACRCVFGSVAAGGGR